MTAPGQRYAGLPVSGGVAAGALYVTSPPDMVTADADAVRKAFAAVAAERAKLAAELRARGAQTEASIVEIGALIAADPALTGPSLAKLADGTDATTAVTEAAAAQAAILAALPDPDLAQRAGDVRQICVAVLAELHRGTAANGVGEAPAGPIILVSRDVDPADLIRLADDTRTQLVGAVSVAGGSSSHAAIVARGLGLPMLAGADPGVLDIPSGHPALLDADAGELIIDPAAPELARVGNTTRPVRPDAPGAVATADGEPVALLCNVASAAETRLGLAGGAAGVGLLRTEIAFSGATRWPAEDEHASQLDPILQLLAGRPAVVRLLDFSGDKIPPFLSGRGSAHGLTALLAAPGALDAQLRAILRAGRRSGAEVGILIPMVTSPDEIEQVRNRLAAIAAELGTRLPELGIMVEVAATAANAARFAKVADFFSIGTNDLTSDVLGIDRADPAASPERAADPRVLDLIASTVEAGREAGIKVSVCGDAAADPDVLPSLLRLGVRAVSVGAARVPRVAAWISAARTGASQGGDDDAAN